MWDHVRVVGGLISYAAAGKQYVAVVSGFAGVYNRVAPKVGGNNPAVTIFAPNVANMSGST